MKTTRKAAAAIAPTPAPKMTAAEILERFEEYMADDIKQARNSLARIAAAKRDELVQIAGLLFVEDEADDKSGAHAAYSFTNLYWGLGDGAEAAGKLKVLSEIRAIYAKIKAEQSDPRAILATLGDRVTEMALDDYRRVENSTNALSNAFAASAGIGRGDAYRDVARRAGIFVKMLDKSAE